jgi:cytochrome c-type biogenesis protein CcmH
LAVVAAVVIVVGLLPGNAAPASDAERARAIAANLRCPFCSGESIADAPAEVARDLQLFISEKVADGWTDDEIYAYFVARYTERVRLDSRFQGWGAALWLTPVALAGVGVAAVLQRRRRPAGATPAEHLAEAVGSDVELT